MGFHKALLCGLVLAFLFYLVKSNQTDLLCNHDWSPTCDNFTFNRLCKFYERKLPGKCIQIVFDPNQITLISKCFLSFFSNLNTTVLVRTADEILDQNIFDYDYKFGWLNNNRTYKYCRTLIVISNDPGVWKSWLDNSIRPNSLTQKRFYPFNNIVIVSQTYPELVSEHYDYIFMNHLQLFWFESKIESNRKSQREFLKVKQVVHLPTKKDLQFDVQDAKQFDEDLNQIYKAGQSKVWHSFHYTHVFRSSQYYCVPYVIPIYNEAGSIIR